MVKDRPSRTGDKSVKVFVDFADARCATRAMNKLTGVCCVLRVCVFVGWLYGKREEGQRAGVLGIISDWSGHGHGCEGGGHELPDRCVGCGGWEGGQHTVRRVAPVWVSPLRHQGHEYPGRCVGPGAWPQGWNRGFVLYGRAIWHMA